MSLPITRKKVEQLRLQAQKSGNPEKIMRYKQADREYSALIDQYFNEENPFTRGFSESHLEELRKKAEESGDESDNMRYLIQRDRFEEQESKKTEGKSLKLLSYELRQKVESGNVTKQDVKDAWTLASKWGNDENKVLYATLKQKLSKEAAE